MSLRLVSSLSSHPWPKIIKGRNQGSHLEQYRQRKINQAPFYVDLGYIQVARKLVLHIHFISRIGVRDTSIPTRDGRYTIDSTFVVFWRQGRVLHASVYVLSRLDSGLMYTRNSLFWLSLDDLLCCMSLQNIFQITISYPFVHCIQRVEITIDSIILFPQQPMTC